MAVAGIGVALSLASTVAGVVGSIISYRGQEQAEKARFNQAADEAQRQKLAQIRQAQVNRAKVTAAAMNQGAGDSSALSGGQSQIAATAARNIQGVNADLAYASQVYKANQQIATGGFVSNLSNGLSSLGGSISQNAGTIERVGVGGLFGVA